MGIGCSLIWLVGMANSCRFFLGSFAALALYQQFSVLWSFVKRRLNAVITSSRLCFLASSKLQYACSALPRRSE